MILVDTSIWIAHLRQAERKLVDLLEAGSVLSHPFVIGEMALGSLKQRKAVLDALSGLPQAVAASDEEVRGLIEGADLPGTGIGYVDAHLLASARLSAAGLWTLDRRLAVVAQRLGVAGSGA